MQIALQPIDYTSQLTGPDLGQALLKGYQEAEARKLAQAQIARQLQLQKELDDARQAAIKSPSVEAFNRLMVLDPQNHEAISKAWQAKDAATRNTELADLSAIRGYLRAGKPEQAQAMIQRRIDADKKAGQDTSDDEGVLAMIGDDPDGAAGLVDYMIAATIGPEKWGETFGKIGEEDRANAKLPSEIAQNVGQATQAQATAAKTLAEAKEVAPNAESDRDLKEAQRQNYLSAIEDRAARLQLDRDTLETNTQLELEKLTRKGVEISPASEKAMTDAVVSAESSRQLATRTNSLADQLEAAPVALGGSFASFNEVARGAFGTQNPVSALRKEYMQLRNSVAIKNLPPGVATDKDVQLALQGLPPPTANKETLVRFLRGYAKLQSIAANREQARADWISENGNLGKAKRDIVVNGVRVPAGSNWLEFSTSQASIERRESAVADRSYMRHGQ